MMPMWAFLPENTHSPLQVPEEYENASMADGNRRTYYGMAHFVDEAIKNVTQQLKDSGLWDDTLILFSCQQHVQVVGEDEGVRAKGCSTHTQERESQ